MQPILILLLMLSLGAKGSDALKSITPLINLMGNGNCGRVGDCAKDGDLLKVLGEVASHVGCGCGEKTCDCHENDCCNEKWLDECCKENDCCEKGDKRHGERFGDCCKKPDCSNVGDCRGKEEVLVRHGHYPLECLKNVANCKILTALSLCIACGQ